ncbi:MAG: hypothetical protein HFH69_12390 [Lachnospiraceae bacterium]|nr:hypothetical protein [Lachnospiraceae bacterium]
MAAKLKNLKVRKVDFVDEGANPDAHIGILKHKAGEQDAGKNGGKAPGFMSRLLNFIGKAAGMDQEEIDSAMDEIQKGDSVSFNEKINEVKNWKIADEIWDVCYALQASLCSILNDEEMDSTSAAAAMKESLDEFTAVVQESIESWSGGKAVNIVKKEEVTETDLEIMKSAVERLQAEIQKADKGTEEPEETGEDNETGKEESDNNNPKGDEEEMKIDKSKLTDAERAFLESIEKRYGTEEGTEGGENAPAEPPAAEPAAKSKTQQETEAPTEQDSGEDGIYKGLHPAVQAELEALKKFKEAAEDRELGQIAEKYAIIGKKKEELVPMFKSLRAAGGTAFDDMIAVLDNAVDVVEKSGAFTEVGKSGHGSASVGQTEEKIETIAKGYMEKDASLDYTSAVAKAWENNPELMEEYEKEAGF